jgi:hypothetical protein
MKLVAIASGLVFLLLGATTSACGSGAASVPPASMPPAAAQPPAAELQLPAKSQDGVEIGASCGESWRPELHEWQSTMLAAIGRDSEYELFDYVFMDGSVYLGLRTASLGLTDAQLEAAHKVDEQFAQGPVLARERGDLLLARAWAQSAAVAGAK